MTRIARTSSVPKTTNPAKLERTRLIEAYNDIWSFADLINFRGGRKKFGKVHHELADFLTKPQCVEDEGNRRRLILMPRGHLKAQSLESVVQTPEGPTRFGNLVVGDYVIGGDGRPVEVVATHPVSNMDLYRVTMSDGRSTLANLEHLWTVTIPSNSPKQITVTTKELLSKYQSPRYDKRTGKHYVENRVRITPVAVQGIEDGSLPIDPYTLGVWLGDGTSSCSSFTCHDDDSAIVERIGCYKNNTGLTWTLKGLVTRLRSANLRNNKHIPEQYFQSSYTQRLDLLRGLMDTDGTCSSTGLPSFTNSNKRLMEDVVRLIRSLGGKAHVCTFESTYPGANKKFTTQTANIWVPCNPFWLQRKAIKWVEPAKIQLVVSNIEYTQTSLGRCITVEAEDGIYLTDDYIPTHNSSVCSVLYTLWRVYRNPNIRILVGNNTKRLGRAFIRELRQYFEHGELQHKVWNKRPHVEGNLVPALSAADRRTRNSKRNNDFTGEEDLNFSTDTKLIWSMEALQVNRTEVLKEPTVMIASVGTTCTGDHYDLLILDDVVDFDNSNTPTKSENILDWTRDLESVLDPRQQVEFKLADNLILLDHVGDEAVILGTRYYAWDFYHYLLEEQELLGVKTFIRNVFVNGVDNSDGYLWPEKFGQQAVERVRMRINNHQRFSSQYLNTILAPEDVLLKLDNIYWFQPDQVHHLQDNTWEVVLRGQPAKRVKPILFLDPAATTGLNSDFSVLTVGGYTEDKEFIVLDVRNGRYTPTQVCDVLFELAEKWSINQVTVEMVAGFKLYEHVIREYMKRNSKVIGVRDYRPTSKLNKRARIEMMLQPLFDNKMFYAAQFLAVNAEFTDELNTFPRCKHDDILDTLASIAEIATPARKKGSTGAVTPMRVINKKWGGVRA